MLECITDPGLHIAVMSMEVSDEWFRFQICYDLHSHDITNVSSLSTADWVVQALNNRLELH